MITINNLQDNIFIVEAHEKITAKDYENILIPFFDEQIKKYDKLNIVYHINWDYDGFELKAMYDDAVFGIWYIDNIWKIALVSDVTWINKSISIFWFLFKNNNFRLFKWIELKEAKKWILEK